ncbi:MAG: NAD(P)H-dependent glycerol-3-phosphate dehydrogenase [Desulfobacterales bacterium]|nr:NAD(P)H-dependent glycerol-3-phosphate dehydrogenase [Desulfobacteraceae bacterium]MDY0311970.1 NAD(P)H-dependent glycerol-3-phosphate dehydrogenase [Desulfobacterales bacterium]
MTETANRKGPPLPEARIAVVGAGSWGTALAQLLADKGYDVDLWTFEDEIRQQIRDLRENTVYLPGCPLSENIRPDTDLDAVVREKDLVVMVVPSHVMRQVAERLSGHLPPTCIVVSASKGIENTTHLTMTGILAETLQGHDPRYLAALSGPSFAREVARRVPTVVTVAARDEAVAAYVQRVFAAPWFRVYTNEDVIGVELGGAVKNVIAIAAGVIDGLGLGLNTRAALITRGLTEIRRLGLALGANPRTFTGLAGMGDLVLTCTGALSRNHTVGVKLGEGKRLEEILAEMRMVAEGVKTAKSVYNLSRRLGVEMPISHEIYRILYEGTSPAEGVMRLMTRDLKDELDEH